MQTFLPYPDFKASARVLDYRRLGKQRVEAKQILQILLNETDKKGWRNHPAVKMWRGHESALAEYGYSMCNEWTKRGYKDSLTPYFLQRMIPWITYPKWIGDTMFHISHQSNLMRKDKEYYKQYFAGIGDNLPYIWPIE